MAIRTKRWTRLEYERLIDLGGDAVALVALPHWSVPVSDLLL